MIFVLFFSAFLILVVLPFLPGIMELVQPQDDRALSINMDYSKDPRYFGNSFKGLLNRALGTQSMRVGTQQISLSKEETVEIIPQANIPAKKKVDHLMVVTGNFTSLADVTFHKEIYVTGEASIGERNTLRALAAEGRVSLASSTKVIRWIDSEGEFVADASCELGWSISSAKKLRIGPDCFFRRLYGMPVMTQKEAPEQEISPTERKYEDIEETAFLSDKDWTIIPPHAKIDKALIFRQNLKIKRHCVLNEDVKTYKKLVLEEGVQIMGNVFAENGIQISSDARIFGNVFSQETIHLGRGTQIGLPGAVKSVVARGEVILDRNVTIYGYVVAGKKGRIL
jgi:predicted acyltransferase (DUF342 family)